MGTIFSRYRKGPQICVKVQITRKKREIPPYMGESHAAVRRGLINITQKLLPYGVLASPQQQRESPYGKNIEQKFRMGSYVNSDH